MIQRWGLKNINEGVGYTDMDMVEDVDGMYVKYADHEAVVKELMEVLETSEALLNDVRRRYPEIETNGFSCPFFRAIQQAIAKAKEVS